MSQRAEISSDSADLMKVAQVDFPAVFKYPSCHRVASGEALAMQRIFMVLAGLPVFMSTAVAQQQPQPLAAPLCAAAVEAGCQCAVLLPSQAGGIAQVTGTEGTVLVTRGASAPVDAAQSEVLSASDRVITGEASNAELLVASSCNLSVPAQSIVTFSSIEGCACAT